MAEQPHLTKEQMLGDCRTCGLLPPQLSELPKQNAKRREISTASCGNCGATPELSRHRPPISCPPTAHSASVGPSFSLPSTAKKRSGCDEDPNRSTVGTSTGQYTLWPAGRAWQRQPHCFRGGFPATTPPTRSRSPRSHSPQRWPPPRGTSGLAAQPNRIHQPNSSQADPAALSRLPSGSEASRVSSRVARAAAL